MASPAGGVIEGRNTIRGAFDTLRNAGAPVAGTNAVQTLTIGGTPTGGTGQFVVGGLVSGRWTWSATNATLLANIQAVLDAWYAYGAIANQVVATAGTLTAGIGTILLTFSGVNTAARVQTLMTAVNSLTGTSPTLAIATTTAGVEVTGLGASPGQYLTDTNNEIAYINTGTAALPVWTKVGTQSQRRLDRWLTL